MCRGWGGRSLPSPYSARHSPRHRECGSGDRGQVRVRYRRMASGTRTISSTPVQTSDWTTHLAVGPPIISARHAVMTTLTGWYVANPCNQLGIASTGTNAEETKMSGKRIGNDITCAVSLFGADRPITANPQESA